MQCQQYETELDKIKKMSQLAGYEVILQHQFQLGTQKCYCNPSTEALRECKYHLVNFRYFPHLCIFTLGPQTELIRK